MASPILAQHSRHPAAIAAAATSGHSQAGAPAEAAAPGAATAREAAKAHPAVSSVGNGVLNFPPEILYRGLDLLMWALYATGGRRCP